jgi:hypothetical protein
MHTLAGPLITSNRIEWSTKIKIKTSSYYYLFKGACDRAKQQIKEKYIAHQNESQVNKK